MGIKNEDGRVIGLLKNFLDTTDDILAKYRRKPSAASDTASVESNQSRTKESTEDERLLIDPNNIELSYAFADAKRKLRMVLSTADLQHIPWSATSEVIYLIILLNIFYKLEFYVIL